MAMNKSEVLSAVADSSGCTKAEAEGVLDAFFATVTSEAKSGNALAWPGFGKFTLSERAARTGRNPQTGESIAISASRGVKFSAAKALKDEMNA
jgi:DNA-binding protein HU-beta